MVEERFSLSDEYKAYLCKDGEQALEHIESITHTQIISRIHGLLLRAADEVTLEKCIRYLKRINTSIRKEIELTPFFLDKTWEELSGKKPQEGETSAVDAQPIMRNRLGQPVQAKTEGQAEVVRAVKENPIVFVQGPAGTGKTFLAVCLAIASLEERRVERISLVRPAVEAGENLGFLPGDLEEKIAPYLRPLYDSIGELLPKEKIKAYQDANAIEVAPLAYMRGRTLKRAFVILDEAQNTTVSQMKMFLTRLGPHSRVIITGDPTQTDLPAKQMSGFSHAMGTLSGIKGIAQIKLDETDVLRHPLVKKIITAYEKVGL